MICIYFKGMCQQELGARLGINRSMGGTQMIWKWFYASESFFLLPGCKTPLKSQLLKPHCGNNNKNTHTSFKTPDFIFFILLNYKLLILQPSRRSDVSFKQTNLTSLLRWIISTHVPWKLFTLNQTVRREYKKKWEGSSAQFLGVRCAPPKKKEARWANRAFSCSQIHEAFSEVNRVQKRQKGGGWSLINRRSLERSEACFLHMGIFFSFFFFLSFFLPSPVTPSLLLAIRLKKCPAASWHLKLDSHVCLFADRTHRARLLLLCASRLFMFPPKNLSKNTLLGKRRNPLQLFSPSGFVYSTCSFMLI